MFKFHLEQTANATILILSGKLDEFAESDLRKMTAISLESEALILSLKDITEINSIGVKLWVSAINVLEKKHDLVFEKCPEVFLNHRSFIPAVTGNGKIKSIILCFECDNCGRTTNKLLDESKFSKEDQIQSEPCLSCGEEVASNIDPRELFSFLDE